MRTPPTPPPAIPRTDSTPNHAPLDCAPPLLFVICFYSVQKRNPTPALGRAVARPRSTGTRGNGKILSPGSKSTASNGWPASPRVSRPCLPPWRSPSWQALPPPWAFAEHGSLCLSCLSSEVRMMIRRDRAPLTLCVYCTHRLLSFFVVWCLVRVLVWGVRREGVTVKRKTANAFYSEFSPSPPSPHACPRFDQDRGKERRAQ